MSCDSPLTTMDWLRFKIFISLYALSANSNTPKGKGSPQYKPQLCHTDSEHMGRQNSDGLAIVLPDRVVRIEAWHFSVRVHSKQDIGNIGL